MPEITLNVEGMSCEGCESNVRSALESLEGVETATPNHEVATVAISYDDQIDQSILMETIESAGYVVAE